MQRKFYDNKCLEIIHLFFKQKATIYNRMICENEKLQIDCKESGKVLNIQRAYYGRYSITPCNKNHIQYTMGCTANNTLDVLKKL